LWKNQTYADVTLASVDGIKIRAHKFILSSCRSFLKNNLLKEKKPPKNPILSLRDIRHKELEIVIRFIYLGQCDVADLELDEFLAVGKELKINGILENVNLNQY
jgi:hypothetical protein